MNEMHATPMPDSSEPNESRKRRFLLIGGGAIGLLAICLCLVVIAVALINPYNIVDRLLGRYDPVANALPADAPMVFTIDLLKLQSSETEALIRTFATAAGEEDITTREDALAEMDDNLQEELGITMSEDILPWVGQYIGIAITDLDMGLGFDLYGSPTSEWLILLESRNNKQADAFLEKLRGIVEEETGKPLIAITHDNLTIYEADTQYDDERYAFTRSGDLIYVGSDADQLITAIEIDPDLTLAKDETYQAMKDSLPKERILTMLVNSSIFEEATQELQSLQPGMSMGDLAIQANMAMSLSIMDAGIQMDMLMDYGDQDLPEIQRTMLESRTGQPNIAQRFPADTFVFLAGSRLDLTWEMLKETYGPMLGESDVEESLELLEMQFGMNPDTDLFPYLDGEYALGLIPSTSGILAQEAEIPMGLLLVLESSDEAALYEFTDALGDLLFMLFEVEDITAEGLYGYEAYNYGGQEPSFAFAVGDSTMFFATDMASMQSSLSRQNSLADAPRYRDAIDALPSNMRLGAYFDIQGILDLVEEQAQLESDLKELEDINVFRPIQSIVSGSSPLEGTQVHGAMIMLIEQ